MAALHLNTAPTSPSLSGMNSHNNPQLPTEHNFHGNKYSSFFISPAQTPAPSSPLATNSLSPPLNSDKMDSTPTTPLPVLKLSWESSQGWFDLATRSREYCDSAVSFIESVKR